MKIIYFVLLSLIWGGSFLGINISLEGYSPFFAATLRVTVALTLSFFYIIIKKVKLPEKKMIVQAIGNGFIGVGIPWALLFWGEQFVPPALCSIINATSPIFTAIFAGLLIRSRNEPVNYYKWAGVFLGFFGIIIIFGPFISASTVENLQGLTAIVMMAVCYGFSIAWLKKISEKMSTSMAMFFGYIGALIALTPITTYYGATHYMIKDVSLLKPTIAILYLGIFSTFVSFILFYKLLKMSGSVQAAAVTYMIPIVSIILDLVVLDKWIGTHALLGAAFVFGAIRLIHKQPTPTFDEKWSISES